MGSDGAEIFYLAPDDTLMAAAVNGKGPNFEVGDRRPLVQMPVGETRYGYCVSPDGQRFLIVSPPDSTPITVVVNWKAGLTGLREK
jgi:hypothetical protein